MKQIFIYFSTLSIVLSLAGVFGLVALSIKQRTRELGIRKVLGAGVADVIRLAVTDFVGLIVLATMMATPMAWYYISKWLQHFAYRVHINWWIFGISGLVILIVTVGTISLQVMRAALANPVKSLRTE